MNCNLDFSPKYKAQKYCKIECYWSDRSRRFSGKNHPRYNKKMYDKDGYVKIHTHDGVILEHRHKIENELGRKLRGDEVVHHINGIRDDNRIENLIVMKRSLHTKHHQEKKIDEGLMVGMIEAGLSFREVGRQLKIHHSTVVKKYKEIL